MPALTRLLHSYLDLLWHYDPAAASAAGVASADGALGRFDAESMRQHLAAFRAVAAAVEELEVEALEDEIDRTALLDAIRTTIARIEYERPHARDPGFWLEHLGQALAALVLREEAEAALAGAALERIKAIPAFLEAGRATLRHPPAPLTDRGLALLGPVGEVLVYAAARFGGVAPGGPGAVETATGSALEAMRRYGTALRDEMEPDPDPRAAALGEQRFERRLHHQHALREGAAELWRAAQRERESLDAQLAAEAADLAPGRDWRELAAELGREPAGDPLAALRDAVERAARGAEAAGIVPAIDAPLEVAALPAPVAALGRDPAYLAHAPGRAARLLIGAGLAERAALPVAVREGVPGRHLHEAFRAAAVSEIRRLLHAPAMSEGWALYAEQLADEAELWDSPGQRLLSLARRAEAVARLALGVGLHARGIAPSEGAALFSEWTGQDGSAAAAAVRRTLAHPGEGVAAEAGRRELVRLRRESGVGMERPGALREFHEAVLSRGGLAPGLVGWSMGLG